MGDSPRELSMDPFPHGLKSTKEVSNAGQTKKNIFLRSPNICNKENFDNDQIGNLMSFYDKLHEELLSTQSKLESFEQSLGMTQVDHIQYKDKFNIFLETMARMEKIC